MKSGHECLGIEIKTVLQAGYVIFLLQPHHQNFGKRLVCWAFRTQRICPFTRRGVPCLNTW